MTTDNDIKMGLTRYSIQPITIIPAYWLQSVHPHSTRDIPLCFFDLEYTKEEKLAWKAGVEYLSKLQHSKWSDYPASIWMTLFTKIIASTKKECNGIKLLPGTGYRTGLGFQYKISNLLILFLYDKNPQYLAELQQYWNATDFEHWKELKQMVATFKQGHPQSKQVFDDFLLSSESKSMESKHWTTLSKIAYIPTAKPNEIAAEMVKFHESFTKQLFGLHEPIDSMTLLHVLEFAHVTWNDIRPFRFGNGRVFRAFMGHVLLHYGYLPIPESPLPKYVEAIQERTLISFWKLQHERVHQYMVSQSGQELLKRLPDQNMVSKQNVVKASTLLNSTCTHYDEPATIKHSSTRMNKDQSKKEPPVSDGKSKKEAPELVELRQLLPLITAEKFDEIVKCDQNKYRKQQWIVLAEEAVKLQKNDLILILLRHQLFSINDEISPALKQLIPTLTLFL